MTERRRLIGELLGRIGHLCVQLSIMSFLVTGTVFSITKDDPTHGLVLITLAFVVSKSIDLHILRKGKTDA